MHEHEGSGSAETVAPLIHPECSMRLFVSFGKLLRGRDAVIAALEGGRQAAIFRARVDRFEWLDENTVLSFARARYALESGGFSEGRVVWLDQIRDGLIWRVRAFKREGDARRAYASMHRRTETDAGEV